MHNIIESWLHSLCPPPCSKGKFIFHAFLLKNTAFFNFQSWNCLALIPKSHQWFLPLVSKILHQSTYWPKRSGGTPPPPPPPTTPSLLDLLSSTWSKLSHQSKRGEDKNNNLNLISEEDDESSQYFICPCFLSRHNWHQRQCCWSSVCRSYSCRPLS